MLYVSFFIIDLLALLYVSLGIVLTCRKHLHNGIISLREEILDHKLV